MLTWTWPLLVSRWDRLLIFGGLNITAALLFAICFILIPTGVFAINPRKFAVLWVIPQSALSLLSCPNDHSISAHIERWWGCLDQPVRSPTLSPLAQFIGAISKDTWSCGYYVRSTDIGLDVELFERCLHSHVSKGFSLIWLTSSPIYKVIWCHQSTYS